MCRGCARRRRGMPGWPHRRRRLRACSGCRHASRGASAAAGEARHSSLRPRSSPECPTQGTHHPRQPAHPKRKRTCTSSSDASAGGRRPGGAGSVASLRPRRTVTGLPNPSASTAPLSAAGRVGGGRAGARGGQGRGGWRAGGAAGPRCAVVQQAQCCCRAACRLPTPGAFVYNYVEQTRAAHARRPWRSCPRARPAPGSPAAAAGRGAGRGAWRRAREAPELAGSWRGARAGRCAEAEQGTVTPQPPPACTRTCPHTLPAGQPGSQAPPS